MALRPELNDRSLELRIKGHLHEIEDVNDDVLDSEQGLPMALMGYESTLINVADCADEEVVDEVANYIKDFISEYERRPKNRKIRREARSMVSKAGYPPTPYLNSA